MNRQPHTRRSLFALACLVGTFVASGAAPAAAQDPVTFRIGITQSPLRAELNPFRTTSEIGYALLSDRYDLLIEFGDQLEPVPGLAESWVVSDDGLTWTYTMRDDVLWQDGEPFTAEDARFTLQYIIDSHDPNYKGPLAPDGNKTKKGKPKNPVSLFDSYLDLADGLDASAIVSVEAPDDKTLVITTSEPLITLGAMYIPILPKHIWKKIPFEQAATGRIELDQAIGTGPFRITDFEPKQVVVLEKFADHWGGTAHIDRLVYQFFDNDEAQVASLLADQVDYLNNAPPSLFPALDGAPGITVNVATGGDFTELGFNSWDPTPERFDDEGCVDCAKGPTTGSVGDPWLTRPDVRAALAGLIDKATLVEFAQGGFGTPGVSVASPVDPLFAYQPDPDDPATFPAYETAAEQDAAHAAAIERFGATMAGLGFEDSDGNGILNVPTTDDGVAFDPEGAGGDWSLRLFVREDDEEDKLAGQLIEQWFEQAGVDVVYEEVSEDPRLYTATYPSSSNADYDMFIWAWGPDPDPDFILSILTCNQINGWQDANYCDPRYDELYAEQHRTLDREARAAIVQEMLGKQYSEAPYAVLWNTNQIEAYDSDRWTGLERLPADTGLVWPTIGFGPYGSLLTVAPVEGS